MYSASLIIAASETWSNDLHTSFSILCAHTWPGVSSTYTALSCTVLRATDTCHILIPTLCPLTTPPSCRYNCYHLHCSHLPITFPFHNTLTIIIILSVPLVPLVTLVTLVTLVISVTLVPLVPLVPLVTLVPLSSLLYVCSYTQTGTQGMTNFLLSLFHANINSSRRGSSSMPALHATRLDACQGNYPFSCLSQLRSPRQLFKMYLCTFYGRTPADIHFT